MNIIHEKSQIIPQIKNSETETIKNRSTLYQVEST